MAETLPAMWPHQEQCLVDAANAFREGHRWIVITGPTGSGKGRTMAEFASRASGKGKRVGLFTNRKLITKQTASNLSKVGIEHGVMADGWCADLGQDVQVMSLQTVSSRVPYDEDRKTFGTRNGWHMPDLDLVIIDEAHSQSSKQAQRVIEHYRKMGAVGLGFTATPVGLGGLYTKLIVAGTNSGLLRQKVLVPCDVYSVDEPDMRGIKQQSNGEFPADKTAQRVMETTVFGNVFDEWVKLNPFRVPTVLWAPDVASSRWFAEQFRLRGVTAAHIDGETPNEEREHIARGSENGSVSVVSSCGVLREGADWPWLAHGVLVQPCGALKTFVQVVGRLLRAYPGKNSCCLQDHSGSPLRHGSPNADRQWNLDEDDAAIHQRIKKAKQNGEPQPISCPRCHAMRDFGPKCLQCGYAHVKSVRMVRMAGGKLIRMVGDVVKKKKQISGEQQAWKSCLYAAANCGHTVAQAAFFYKQRTGKDLPVGIENRPPHDSLDWRMKVSDVFPWIKPKRKVAT